MEFDISGYKAVFFDFDGVIVDSLGVKTQAFGDLFSRYGNDMAEKVMAYHCSNGGVSRYEKFQYYYKVLLKQEITTEIMDSLDKAYSRLVVKKVVAAPYVLGVLDFISGLRKANKPCFVISATPEKEIRRIIRTRKIKSFFKDVAGSPRNKKENLEFLLDKYSIDPKSAVYFGDAKSDYKAAKDIGVDFIGIVNQTSKELKKISGITKIKDFI